MKVVSFVLWGDNPLYTLGAIQNSKDVFTMYPGWESWVYVCGKIPSDILHKLKQVASKVVPVRDLGNCKNTFWRYSPVLYKSVKVFTSRDCDSRITQRECSLVKQWEESKKDLHIIRDHIGHTTPHFRRDVFYAPRLSVVLFGNHDEKIHRRGGTIRLGNNEVPRQRTVWI